jgi:Flp pilus assembly protein TadD/glutathione synthase/RimK-type ligase-like ATP-grasp enzyme
MLRLNIAIKRREYCRRFIVSKAVRESVKKEAGKPAWESALTGPSAMSASPRIAANAETGWAPRRMQELRLRQLEDWLADQSTASTDLAIERAALLGALDRSAEAQQAFVDILRSAPDDFNALNEFGGLLTSMGAIAAASRVYAEAITHHPGNPIGHVNLANLLLRTNEYGEAREHYETALRIDPEHQGAHQGLGAVLSDLGDRAAARVHFEQGFRGCAISTLPYRGAAPPIAVLQLVSSGGGNIPTASLLDDRTFQVTVVVADHADPNVELPPHHLVFNAIGDADFCAPALKSAVALMKRTRAPVINHPRSIVKTGRIDNARRLCRMKDVVVPHTVAMSRNILEDADAAAAIARAGLAFPLLLRSPGFHTGRNFVLVEQPGDLAAAVAGLPGDDLLAIEYLDARGSDGNARKYRVMFIGGVAYPLHLAISRQWKVHYFTSDMADRADHRAEEAAFLADMTATLGERAVAALERIGAALGLDYGGIDFGVGRSGEVLLFEANATMVVIPPGDDQRWAHRRVAVTRILDAVLAMIMKRARDRTAR